MRKVFGIQGAAVWLVAWWIVGARALGGLPLVFTALVVLGAGVAAVIALAFYRKRLPGDRALARYIEEQHPALEDRLVTAVQVAGENRADASMRGALLADTAQVLPSHRLLESAVAALGGDTERRAEVDSSVRWMFREKAPRADAARAGRGNVGFTPKGDAPSQGE